MAEMKAVYLPCNVGDIVYVKCAGSRIPGRRRVTDIHICASTSTVVTVMNDRTGAGDRYLVQDFGKEIFTSLTEAEAALMD